MSSEQTAPRDLLSVIIPCRNEARYIARCLDSVVSSDYPKDRLEIFVIDGQSDDGTRKILEDYRRRYPYITVLENARRITPCALNTGIRAARGTVILRMDAHARITPSYLSHCVNALSEYDADNAGGTMETLPATEGIIGRGIVRCLSHRFGVGNSAFRTGVKKATFVDTVFGGCYRRQVFDKIGLFNEQLVRTQDLEFNLRLKRAGGRTVLVPGIVSQYYAKSEFGSFVRHNFRNGAWSVLPFLYSPIVPVSARHLVPLAFVSGLLAAGVLTVIAPGPGKWILAAAAAPYLLLDLGASFLTAWRDRKPSLALTLPFLFPALHISYGLGSLYGLLKTGVELIKRKLNLSQRPGRSYEKSF